MTSKEVLVNLLSGKNISMRNLEKAAELKGGFLTDINRGKKNFSNEAADAIVRVFPDINKLWVLTGEGKMYLADEKKATQKEEVVQDLRLMVADLQKQVVSYQRQKEIDNKTIANLTNTNSLLAANVERLTATNEELVVNNEDLVTTNQDLTTSVERLTSELEAMRLTQRHPNSIVEDAVSMLSEPHATETKMAAEDVAKTLNSH